MAESKKTDPRFDLLREGMSRRGFLSAMGATGAAAALAACGTSSDSSSGEDAAPEGDGMGARADEGVVVWANWTEYLDYKGKTNSYPTLERFEKVSGYDVEYKEDIDDNNSFNGKVEPLLQNGQDIGYDLVTPSDSLVSEWIRKGYAAQIDYDNVPNVKNLLPALLDVNWDPGRKFSLTWQSGFTGLAWNEDKIPGGLKSVEDLWDPKLKGKVVVLSEMTDTMGLIMLSQGVDVSQPITEEQFQAALDVLKEQLDSGQIKQVKGNGYLQDLRNEQAWAAIAWSGDIFQLNYNPKLPGYGFALPDTGGMLWSDNLVIPTTTQNKVGAEAIMDYYYDPKVAAEVAAWVNYVCPVQGAQEEMKKIDPELADSEWIFPTDELLEQSYVFTQLTPQEETQYEDAFGRVTQG